MRISLGHEGNATFCTFALFYFIYFQSLMLHLHIVLKCLYAQLVLKCLILHHVLCLKCGHEICLFLSELKANSLKNNLNDLLVSIID